MSKKLETPQDYFAHYLKFEVKSVFGSDREATGGASGRNTAQELAGSAYRSDSERTELLSAAIKGDYVAGLAARHLFRHLVQFSEDVPQDLLNFIANHCLDGLPSKGATKHDKLHRNQGIYIAMRAAYGAAQRAFSLDKVSTGDRYKIRLKPFEGNTETGHCEETLSGIAAHHFHLSPEETYRAYLSGKRAFNKKGGFLDPALSPHI